MIDIKETIFPNGSVCHSLSVPYDTHKHFRSDSDHHAKLNLVSQLEYYNFKKCLKKYDDDDKRDGEGYRVHYLDYYVSKAFRKTVRGIFLHISDDGKSLLHRDSVIRLAIDGKKYKLPCYFAPWEEQSYYYTATNVYYWITPEILKELAVATSICISYEAHRVEDVEFQSIEIADFQEYALAFYEGYYIEKQKTSEEKEKLLQELQSLKDAKKKREEEKKTREEKPEAEGRSAHHHDIIKIANEETIFPNGSSVCHSLSGPYDTHKHFRPGSKHSAKLNLESLVESYNFMQDDELDDTGFLACNLDYYIRQASPRNRESGIFLHISVGRDSCLLPISIIRLAIDGKKYKLPCCFGREMGITLYTTDVYYWITPKILKELAVATSVCISYESDANEEYLDLEINGFQEYALALYESHYIEDLCSPENKEKLRQELQILKDAKKKREGEKNAREEKPKAKEKSARKNDIIMIANEETIFPDGSSVCHSLSKPYDTHKHFRPVSKHSVKLNLEALAESYNFKQCKLVYQDSDRSYDIRFCNLDYYIRQASPKTERGVFLHISDDGDTWLQRDSVIQLIIDGKKYQLLCYFAPIGGRHYDYTEDLYYQITANILKELATATSIRLSHETGDEDAGFRDKKIDDFQEYALAFYEGYYIEDHGSPEEKEKLRQELQVLTDAKKKREEGKARDEKQKTEKRSARNKDIIMVALAETIFPNGSVSHSLCEPYYAHKRFQLNLESLVESYNVEQCWQRYRCDLRDEQGARLHDLDYFIRQAPHKTEKGIFLHISGDRDSNFRNSSLRLTIDGKEYILPCYFAPMENRKGFSVSVKYTDLYYQITSEILKELAVATSICLSYKAGDEDAGFQDKKIDNFQEYALVFYEGYYIENQCSPEEKEKLRLELQPFKDAKKKRDEEEDAVRKIESNMERDPRELGKPIQLPCYKQYSDEDNKTQIFRIEDRIRTAGETDKRPYKFPLYLHALQQEGEEVCFFLEVGCVWEQKAVEEKTDKGEIRTKYLAPIPFNLSQGFIQIDFCSQQHEIQPFVRRTHNKKKKVNSLLEGTLDEHVYYALPREMIEELLHPDGFDLTIYGSGGNKVEAHLIGLKKETITFPKKWVLACNILLHPEQKEQLLTAYNDSLLSTKAKKAVGNLLDRIKGLFGKK